MQKLGNEHLLKFLNGSKNIDDDAYTILVGKIIAAHGIKGTVKVIPFSESLSLYTSLNNFLVRPYGSSVFTKMDIIWAKPYKRCMHFCFKGINTRNKAELLIGFRIYVRKSVLPPLDDDTYFWSDLIGMSVKSVTGEIIGYIDHIICTGSNDVYVVRPNQIDVKGKEILIPAIKSIVLSVNLTSNLMLVDLPEDIRDINL